MKNYTTFLPILSAAHSASFLPNVMDITNREKDDTGVPIAAGHLPAFLEMYSPGLTF
jgi:hypothetical protein